MRAARLEKQRYTIYLPKKHVQVLRELAEETGRPISAFIGEALDEFLSEIDRLDERQIPPVDKDFYRPRRKVHAST